ncbi:NAD-dependent epimerase/dehydratase family protein [Schlesneria paludicola]|uniref:NAD-dependent epimerase/dehydratase family protein n=1 Tax=Schlesneria paludicola TaxID=360056 RepID=UPI00029AD829|nr:NAD-dependent epimerase/dehydratase family protein [Schlesneria paludicola]
MRVLVTGGGGFLGQAIVRRLIARGDSVRSLQRSAAPTLEAWGVDCVRGDLTDLAQVQAASEGCDLVFHVAAKAGVWGKFDEYYRANVVGTDNVLAACRSQGIPKLVYTSSPSVVFTGHDEQGIDESVPYPKTYLTHYPQTKAIAEQRVLAANGAALSTVALRPHLIWGPGDNHLVPRLIQRAQSGRLRRVGNGENLVDATYIDNAADAHLLAADRLGFASVVAGKAYFISNGEPIPLWTLVDRLLACAGVPPVSRSISASTALLAGGILEFVYRLTGRRDEPPMTRFVARQLSTSHWYRLDAARRDLGYDPKISIDEGLKRLTDSLRQS